MDTKKAIAQAIIEQQLQARNRNSVNVEKACAKLCLMGVEVDDVLDALDGYTSIERSDYDEAIDYSDARTEAWDVVIEALENLDTDSLE